jgi:hypothetical protein
LIPATFSGMPPSDRLANWQRTAGADRAASALKTFFNQRKFARGGLSSAAC